MKKEPQGLRKAFPKIGEGGPLAVDEDDFLPQELESGSRVFAKRR